MHLLATSLLRPYRHGVYDSAGKLLLKSLTLKELEEWCAMLGEGACLAKGNEWRVVSGGAEWRVGSAEWRGLTAGC